MRLTPDALSDRRRAAALENLARRVDSGETWDRRAAWPVLPVFVVLAAAWVAFSWPWLSGRFLIPWDAKAHFAPQIQFLAQSLARGESPFWLPYAFSGLPQIADPQSMMFSPPFLALAALNGDPSLHAIDVTVMLALLAAGSGVLLLTRDWGWHWGAASIAALGFAFGAAMAWRLQHFGQVLSLAYLPFAWLFLERALTRGSALYGALAGLVGACIVLGRDQVGLLCVYCLVLIALAHILAAERPMASLVASIKPLAAGTMVGLGVAGLPLIMTVLYAGLSNRPEIDFVGAGRGSLHPALLVTALVPHLFGPAGRMEDYWGPPSFAWRDTDLFIAQNMGQVYIAAPLLLLLVVGVVRGVLWERDARLITILLGIVLLYALGSFTPVFRVFYEFLPGVGLYRRPADAVFLIGAFGALAAGHVANRLLTGTLPDARWWQRVLEVGIPLGIFAFALALAFRMDRVAVATTPLMLAAGWTFLAAVVLVFADRARLIRPFAPALALVALTAADLATNNGPNGASALPPSELSMLDTASRSPTLALLKSRVRATTNETDRPRVELAGLGFHWPNASLPHRLENTLGYNPVRLATYSRAVGAGDTVGLPDQRQFTRLFPSYRSTLADLLGLRFIATGVAIEQMDKRLQPGDLTLVANTGDGYVYENRRALPRVVFATEAKAASFEEIIASGDWPAVDFRDTVLVEGATQNAQRRPGTARISAYRNTSVALDVDSADGGFVVLHDIWHPWWRATIDGAAAPILKANVLFRAVQVPPGRHSVVFSFHPVRGAFAELGEKLIRAKPVP